MNGDRLNRLLPWAVIVAVAGVGLAVIGAFTVSAQAFFAGWLAAYVYGVSLPLGAVSLLMIHDLVGGEWGEALRPLLEAAAATLPLFVLLFLPIPLAGLAVLYPWARPDTATALHNTFYLNVAGFVARAAAYYVIWLLSAFLTLRRSRAGLLARDRAGSWVSAVGLVVIGVSVTFASFDWIMSIEPRWSSTMFGMIIGSSQFITAVTVLVLLAVTLGPATGAADAKLRKGLGTILLVSLLFWSYVEFVQYLEIWEENLRDEIPWYLLRFKDGWQAVAIVVVFGRFVLPFLLLIWAPLRRHRVWLGAICAWLVLINLLYVWWLILPVLGGFGWPIAAAACGVGGVWVAALLAWLKTGDRVGRWLAPRRLGHA
jgi:hypothetical protein